MAWGWGPQTETSHSSLGKKGKGKWGQPKIKKMDFILFIFSFNAFLNPPFFNPSPLYPVTL